MARSGPKRALTVAATLAGLSLAVTGVGGATGCGDDTTTSSSASSSDDDGTGGMNVGSAYGVGPTTGPGGSGGAGGVAASGQGGMNVGSAYGVGPTTGAGGGGGRWGDTAPELLQAVA